MIIHKRYQVQSLLGKGAMGKVYLVQDLNHKSIQRVLKIIDIELDSSLSDYLKHEFELLARLNHPNIAQVYDYGEFQEEGKTRFYFTGEYVKGMNFCEAIKKFEKKIMDLTVQILRALNYLHSKGIIHRDIKPQNVLVQIENQPKIKLIDFGVATGPFSGFLQGITGTLPYLAPEILSGQGGDHRSDLYSLGVLLYEAISGTNPFEAPSVSKIIKKHFEFTPPPLSYKEESFRIISMIVSRLLAKEPGKRYPTANTVIREINKITNTTWEIETKETKESYVLSAPLVGRKNELKRLIEICEDLTKPSPSYTPCAVLLHGEIGIGKTRLLQEIKLIAQLEGLNVIQITDTPFSSAYHPWQEILKKTSPKSDLPILNLLNTPEIEKKEIEKFKLFQLFYEYLLNLSKDKGTVLLLDEIQTWDEPSLDLLSYISRGFISHKITPRQDSTFRFFLLAAVNKEIRQDKKILKKIEELKDLCETINLSPLSQEEIAQLIYGVIGEKKRAQTLLTPIMNQTGGNPLLIMEFLRALASAGRLHPDDPAEILKPIDITGIKLPKNILANIQQKIETLTSKAQIILKILTISKRPLNHLQIAKVSNLPLKETLALLRDLEDLLLIKSVFEKNTINYKLQNATVLETILNMLKDEDITPLHLSLAKTLEQFHNITKEELAYHYLKAKQKDKGIAYGITSAKRLEKIHAIDHAIEIYEAILDLDLKDSPQILKESLRSLARLKEISGDYEKAKETYLKLKELNGKNAFEANLGIISCEYSQGKLNSALNILNQIGGTLEDDPSKLAEITEKKAKILYQQGNYEEAIKTCKEILSRPNIKRYQRGALFRLIGTAQYAQGKYNEAIKNYKKSLKSYILSEESYDEAISLVLANLAIIWQRRLRYKIAERLYKKSIKILREIKDLKFLPNQLLNLGTLYQLQEEFSLAFSLYHECLGIAERTGNSEIILQVSKNLGNLYLSLGDTQQAKNYLSRSLELSKKYGFKKEEGFSLFGLGEVLAIEGERKKAEENYKNSIEIFRRLKHLTNQTQVEIYLANLYRLNGRYQEANSILSEVFSKINDITDKGLLAQASGVTALLYGEDLEGDLKKGEELAKKTIKYSSEGKLREWEWRGHIALGKIWKRQGYVREALEEFTKAREIVLKTTETLPEDLKETYLKVPERQMLFREWEELKAIIKETSFSLPFKEPSFDYYKRLEKLISINKEINSEREIKFLLERIIDAALELTSGTRGFVILVEDKKFKVLTARNIAQEKLKGAEFEVSRSIAKEVVNTGRGIISTNAVSDKRFASYLSVHSLKLKSLLCTPLKVRAKVVGVLYLDNPKEPRAFTEKDLDVIAALADQAAIAIENAKYREKSQRSHEKLWQDHKRLKIQIAKKEEELQRVKQTLDLTRKELGSRYEHIEIIGESYKFSKVFNILDKIIPTDVEVVIYGESGTGKELIARAIHYNGPRKNGPFVSVNCGAVPDQLLMSELFGHVKGAFTGAHTSRQGLFVAASEGTLFLDEIGETSPQMQRALLRAIQEKEIRPLGSEKTIKVNPRIIAASNQDLAKLMEAKKFRKDLYYRLNVVKINLPPLRERKEDIPLLVNYFLNLLTKDTGRKKEITAGALKLLQRYNWPGNIRELENEIKRAAILADTVITPESLSPYILEAASQIPLDEESETIAQTEAKTIRQALYRARGNKAKAARLLGIGRSSLYQKILKYNIKEDRHEIERMVIKEALTQTEGNKDKAAKLLGMSQQALYRKLKNLNLN